MSNGETCFLSKATPTLFKDGQEVLLNGLYDKIMCLFGSKLKYKKYFSIWTVFGSAWSIEEGRHYYEIRQGYVVFAWVTADQIREAGKQKQIAEGQPNYYRKTVDRQRREHWIEEQQSLDPNDPRAKWEAGSADIRLRERLRRRQKK